MLQLWNNDNAIQRNDRHTYKKGANDNSLMNLYGELTTPESSTSSESNSESELLSQPDSESERSFPERKPGFLSHDDFRFLGAKSKPAIIKTDNSPNKKQPILVSSAINKLFTAFKNTIYYLIGNKQSF